MPRSSDALIVRSPVEFIEATKWRFASSMPQVPHWYIVKDKLEGEDRSDFDYLARHIRVYGRLGIWGANHLHWYWRPREHPFYYWTMGWPLEETIIINRAKVETDNVRYLDEMNRVSPRDRALLEKWADWTECPHCFDRDAFAVQWAGDGLVGIFCSSCRQRFL